MKPFMTRLEFHRRLRGLSSTQAAKLIGISTATLLVYEAPRSRRQRMRQNIKEAIEGFYGHSWEYLRRKCR